jgi:hypothetical protein
MVEVAYVLSWWMQGMLGPSLDMNIRLLLTEVILQKHRRKFE